MVLLIGGWIGWLVLWVVGWMFAEQLYLYCVAFLKSGSYHFWPNVYDQFNFQQPQQQQQNFYHILRYILQKYIFLLSLFVFLIFFLFELEIIATLHYLGMAKKRPSDKFTYFC